MTRWAARWFADLSLGMRLAVGGRESRIRMLLTGVGIGMGVALLLLATSVPHMLDARTARSDARADQFFSATRIAAADDTLLIGAVNTDFRDTSIRGRLVQPEGPRAPRPPGVAKLPAPGQMVVSPALRHLLASPEGALLRERLPYRIVGTIGQAGLVGPKDHSYVAGTDRLDTTMFGVQRIDHFGERQQSEPLDAFLLLIVVVGCCVLLFPVAVFIAVAVRYGGENRDRRLAALRLVGVDRRMAARIAVGEAMAGTLVGLALGAGFFLAGRGAVERVSMFDVTVFAGDVRPTAGLAVLVVVMVPLCTLLATLAAMRSVVAEPLGVVRRVTRVRRRLWWRPVPALLGVALLVPLIGSAGRQDRQFDEYRVTAGVLLLMLGLVALLPWLVEAVVHRLGGSAVAWQLAIRRLQVHSGTPVRAVSGVAVAVTGVVALQMLFGAADEAYTKPTGWDASRSQMVISQWLPDRTGRDAVLARQAASVGRLAAVPGVEAVRPLAIGPVHAGTHMTLRIVADCDGLRDLLVLDGCADGDTFLVTGTSSEEWLPAAGAELADGDSDEDGSAARWTVPTTARHAVSRPDVPLGFGTGVYVTPAAAAANGLVTNRLEYRVRLDIGRRDILERVRNAAVAVDPMARVTTFHVSTRSPRLITIRNALNAGMVATMLLIGASLLIGLLEQLRDRRRLLAVLAAFGTRRTTMSWSVLWQNTVPMLLGLALALPAGIGFGMLLLAMTRSPLAMDWPIIGLTAGAASATVLLTTALSMPPLWRMMRPSGLRTE